MGGTRGRKMAAGFELRPCSSPLTAGARPGLAHWQLLRFCPRCGLPANGMSAAAAAGRCTFLSQGVPAGFRCAARERTHRLRGLRIRNGSAMSAMTILLEHHTGVVCYPSSSASIFEEWSLKNSLLDNPRKRTASESFPALPSQPCHSRPFSFELGWDVRGRSGGSDPWQGAWRRNPQGPLGCRHAVADLEVRVRQHPGGRHHGGPGPLPRLPGALRAQQRQVRLGGAAAQVAHPLARAFIPSVSSQTGCRLPVLGCAPPRCLLSRVSRPLK